MRIVFVLCLWLLNASSGLYASSELKPLPDWGLLNFLSNDSYRSLLNSNEEGLIFDGKSLNPGSYHLMIMGKEITLKVLAGVLLGKMKREINVVNDFDELFLIYSSSSSSYY